MSTVNVKAHLINGGLLEWQMGPEFLEKLDRLRRNGLEGKRLINELLTDDWGAPPTVVVITRSEPPLEEIRIHYA
jgi:hypothetical protein